MTMINMYRPGNSQHLFTKRQLRCAGWTDSQIEMFCTETPVDVPSSPDPQRLHQIRNACTLINKAVEPYNTSIDCSAAIRATVEAMIDAGYHK